MTQMNKDDWAAQVLIKMIDAPLDDHWTCPKLSV